MGKTVAETIKGIAREHLEKGNGLLLGQSLTAVGWVNNTVPDCAGVVELPMADVVGSGIAVGVAVAGRRPIFVTRYQDFILIGLSPIVNYAAKSKDILGTGTPIFVRLISDEGHGLGPVHSGKLHSIFMHFPGLRVCSPMTPKEYQEAWEVFMVNDDPMIVCEHRHSYQNASEVPDVVGDADVTIFGISTARFNMTRAAEMLLEDGIRCNLIHIMWLKPFTLDDRLLVPLTRSKAGIVVDSGFELAGASQSIAYQLMYATRVPVKALGLYDRSVGVTPESENLTPDPDRIARNVKEILKC